MKKILLRVTDEQAKVLEQQINQSEYIRKAIDVYNDTILTDSREGILAGFKKIADKLEEHDVAFEKLDKLIDQLSYRM
jgi:hypothetical protein